MQTFLTFLWLSNSYPLFFHSFPPLKNPSMLIIHHNGNHSPSHSLSTSSHCTVPVHPPDTRFHNVIVTTGCLVIKKHQGKNYAKFARPVKRKIVSKWFKVLPSQTFVLLVTALYQLLIRLGYARHYDSQKRFLSQINWV